MMRHGDRTINVNKNNLIGQIKANKEKHIEEYEKAVVAYKKEAEKQLMKELARLNTDGALDIKLNLVEPVNNADNYDKVVDMFQWEENEIVELTQNEFREYVQDETDFALQAKMSNAFYVGG